MVGWYGLPPLLLGYEVRVATTPQTAWIIKALCIVEASVKWVCLCWRHMPVQASYLTGNCWSNEDSDQTSLKWCPPCHNPPLVTYFTACLTDIFTTWEIPSRRGAHQRGADNSCVALWTIRANYSWHWMFSLSLSLDSNKGRLLSYQHRLALNCAIWLPLESPRFTYWGGKMVLFQIESHRMRPC